MNDQAPFISLSPRGKLSFGPLNDLSRPFLELHKKFSSDWREGWFYLAADKTPCDRYPSLRFWQEIAEYYLTELCHFPEEIEFSPVKTPEENWINDQLLKMPPIKGGEYLSFFRLNQLWKELNLWTEQAAERQGGIHSFLQKQAPKWQQVGRVCFHLAENKRDLERPFAFLATYSTGFAITGKLKHLPLKKALEQSSRENNLEFLIKLLTPVQKAAKQCSWVQSLVKTNEIYQPLAWSVNQAHTFLQTIPILEESGLSVRIPNWWKHRSRPQVAITIESKSGSNLGLENLLSFNVELALEGERLSKEELEGLAAAKEGLVYLRGQWVEVDGEKLKQALAHWEKMKRETKDGEISFIEGMRLLAGAPSELRQEEETSWIKVCAGNTLEKLLKQLRDPSQLSIKLSLSELKAVLRPYQQEGVQWLFLLSGLGLGACLADDMGLGKTLQVLSLLLLHQKKRQNGSKKPSLLIVPASLLGNWKREASHFTPSLNLLFAHPSEADSETLAHLKRSPETLLELEKIDLVVTTYAMVAKQKWLLNIHWNLLILDEAQAIKNQGTKQSLAVKAVKSHSRIALTGTPIENRLSDLWSLFDFLNPGLLGSSSRFKEYVKELQKAPHQFESLRKLTSPYILRRMKTDSKIISDLPEKIETSTYCHLTKKQAHDYQAVLSTLKISLETTDHKNRRAIVLQTLMRLKQICNHPTQFNGEGDYLPKQSGKFTRLAEICEELSSRQEKVLIFTQFSEIIHPIANYLTSIFRRPGLSLHGSTPIQERKKRVEEFQDENGPPFFVLSLRAGGTGLTLTAATHVIHFDRWWNPAVENQATDRAFRIGQKKNVQVHKFITRGTIEEKIDEMITSKKSLANDVLAPSEEIKITELSDDKLLELVALDINQINTT